MSPRSCVGRGWVFVAVVASVAAAGCRTGQWASGKPGPCPVDVAPPIVSRVMPGDTLHGHLYPDQGCQCFYFEGVEYGVLSVELKTDVGNQAAPYLAIYGPDDAPLPLGDGFGPEGSARKRADGIVLPRTGTYRATVCKAPCEPESYWSFSYDVAILSPG